MGRKRNTLLYAFLLSCLLSFLLVPLAEGKRNNNNNNNKNNNNRAGRSGKQGRDRRCKNKTTFTLKTSDLKRSGMTLKCAHGPVVSTQLLGIKGRCRGTTGFTRWTEGRCLWNSTCQLTFQDQVIDSLHTKVKDKSCLGKIPDKLELKYTCLKKKVTVSDTLGNFTTTRKKAGIIRSHKMFPWSYRNGEELGNVTILKPRKPAGPTTLWISVHMYSLRSSDIVFLSWDESPPRGRGRERGRERGRGGSPFQVQALRQILPNDTLLSLPGVKAVNLTFYADYRGLMPSSPSEKEEEKGFLLCYQWLKNKARPKKNSACTKVMMPAKCQNKRGGRRGRGGKPRSGKRSRPGSNKPRVRSNNKRPRNNRPGRNRQQ